jgi:hypothetical protein
MANLAEIKFYLSGTDGTVGGAKGANQVLSQTATGITTITGVTINDAAGNNEGNGSLSFTSSTQKLTWTPPSGTAGTAVDVSVNGTYALQGGSNGGVLIVTVVAASLPGANLSNTIAVVNIANEVFDDVTKAESYAGVTRYRAVYFCNTSAADAKKLAKLWIASNTPGLDTIAIGLDPAGAGGTAATIANENTAPAGVTFTTPDSESTALSIGDLAVSQDYPFWIKELVPAACDVATAANTFKLAFSVLV